jgi:hypothetical protein
VKLTGNKAAQSRQAGDRVLIEASRNSKQQTTTSSSIHLCCCQDTWSAS